MIMSDYLNDDNCEFMNDATSSSFGWNFQSNAGIFLFLKYMKEAESIKIESKLQDIEIKLTSGSKILAQAKSSQDYTIATDKKEKFKDAIISLAKFSNQGDKLIYISNIPNTFNNAQNSFNNKIVEYSSCLQGIRNEIDQVFDSTCKSIRDKLVKEQDSQKISKIKKILELVENFDKKKLYISVISPFWGDEQNRYSEIANAILAFLVNDLKLSNDDAIAIRQRLLDHWQLKFQHNSSQPDKNEIKKISKEEFVWPIAVFLTKDDLPDIADCLSFVPDQALIEEVKRTLSHSEMIYHDRFEFTNKVIQDYMSFKKRQPNGTNNIEKIFVRDLGNDYYYEFRADNDEEKMEYITKAFIYKLLINHRNMVRIQSGIGGRNGN